MAAAGQVVEAADLDRAEAGHVGRLEQAFRPRERRARSVPSTSISSPSDAASRSLTIRPWRIEMRWPMTNEVAASYAE